MMQPPGFVQTSSSSLVCKLHKALYGLKQAPRAWYEHLSQYLHSLGFCTSKADCYLLLQYGTDGSCCFVLIYVDDIIIMASSSIAIASLVHKLHATFALKDLE